MCEKLLIAMNGSISDMCCQRPAEEELLKPAWDWPREMGRRIHPLPQMLARLADNCAAFFVCYTSAVENPPHDCEALIFGGG